MKDSYPTMPGSENAGFIFRVPKPPAGSHSVTVVVAGKDGGRTELRRQLQIK